MLMLVLSCEARSEKKQHQGLLPVTSRSQIRKAVWKTAAARKTLCHLTSINLFTSPTAASWNNWETMPTICAETRSRWYTSSARSAELTLAT